MKSPELNYEDAILRIRRKKRRKFPIIIFVFGCAILSIFGFSQAKTIFKDRTNQGSPEELKKQFVRGLYIFGGSLFLLIVGPSIGASCLPTKEELAILKNENDKA